MKKNNLLKILPEVKEHVVMRDHTSFHIGGVADFFYEARTVDELIKAVKAAIKIGMPYFVLGSGSNILFSDYGFAGLVIKNSTRNISLMREKSQVIADSGVMLPRLLMELASNDLSGLEFLFGVPGTVGGAVYGNAGGWGNSIGDFVKVVTLLEKDPASGKVAVKQYDARWLDFSYRDSKLKQIKSTEKPVILTVRLQLALNQKEEIIRRLNAIRAERQKKQPIGLSAGSIFKNPIPKELTNIAGAGTRGMPELPKERTAGFLLEEAGAKKLKVGDAAVSALHANFIVNTHEAKAQEVRTLVEEMRRLVDEKYGLVLQEEIEYVGQW